MPTVRVTCPKCREIMEIETRTGTVLKHHPEKAKKPGDDSLAARIKGLEEEKTRREAIVAESREKEKTKKSVHDELFSKVRKTAAEGPAERPIRDIDFD